jgi:predicted Zn-dependent protease
MCCPVRPIAGIIASALLLISCERASPARRVPEELRRVHAAVARVAGTDAIQIDSRENGYLRVSIANSTLRDLPDADKRQAAREIATLAYTSQPLPRRVQVVDVVFRVEGRRLGFIGYADGRDAYRFDASELERTETLVSEGWSPDDTPERDLYFIAVGDVPDPMMRELVAHFQSRLNVPIAVLPALAFDRTTFDPVRSQVVADRVISEIRIRHATLARDPRTRVIGITPYDMYMKATERAWNFTFSLRSEDRRLAVVSYARMDPANLTGRPHDDLLKSRLRKMIAKNIGIMHYDLPFSQDPRSVLFGNILGLDDLDGMSEFFEPR